MTKPPLVTAGVFVGAHAQCRENRSRNLHSVVVTSKRGSGSAQHLTYTEWLHRAMADIRLLPRYGDREKNDAQRASDAEFIAATLTVDSVPRSASGRLVQHGAKLLADGELTKAMYRFNQAWLVDS